MTITASNISYWIGQQPILHRLSFNIVPGQLTVVLGQNGAGKSTFLKILSGEQRPTMGRVLLGNSDLHRIPVHKLATMRAVLSQQYAVALGFSCEEIVLMGRYPHYGSRPAEADWQIVRQCMDEMQVSHLASRPYQSLSGGEQQRVQLARVLAQLTPADAVHKTGAYARNEGILLLDEPTSNMDILYQQLCLTKARELARRGYTVVVILHDLNLAAQFADTILLLKAGRMVQYGTVAEVLQPSFIAEAYGLEVDLVETPEHGFPIIVPAAYRTNDATNDDNNFCYECSTTTYDIKR
ncbi:MAG: heme ABC transporter ATP-binding protein [Candidatus Pseudobacter hemicellulosilyticus]|uniref:Heme ABC transporter ATP-binding protein n=1 Tax=Candidatus Pseudobacter hemicellulosilyticus TaxID=3121375 RepID=A0AAJ5WXB7_9BACT|nr:MAG: heme ABC transporter ATP-binding protein [Pseudobacter sp.]